MLTRTILAALAVCALAGCGTSYGLPANGFFNDTIARAFIPLEGRTLLIRENRASAFVIAPGIAVTNAHTENFLDSVSVIGKSRFYDLLFFRTDKNVQVSMAAPWAGERVFAYGEGSRGELRMAAGVIRTLNAPVEPRCQSCPVQAAFTFDAVAGPGFSGGPVIDATTGQLVGITFGFTDSDDGKSRLMYAYPMSRVRNELATIQGRVPTDVN